MGWRGTNIGPNSGAANMYVLHSQLCVQATLTASSGAYFFIGGPFLLISGLLEFFLGNTFTFVVFVSYG
jgi:succinate-acetate transporter protein